MGFIYEERSSDSPFIETIMQGRTAGRGSTIRPAESHWHMVFTAFQGNLRSLVVGPLTAAGVVPYVEGAKILWIRFKLGVFMPYLSPKEFRDTETDLPEAGSRSFWLGGSAWQVPSYENADAFVSRLIRKEMLVQDPVVSQVLQGQPPDISPRTVRHRFLRATGLTQNHVHQINRAQRAAALLEAGVSIFDTIDELGYYDQPHLTRSLKQWNGFTPARIARAHPFA